MMNKLKERLQKEENTTIDLPKNHRSRFENRLQTELHQKAINNYGFLRITAVFILLISLGVLLNNTFSKEVIVKQNYTLGSLSPELEKIESYYTNAIAYELSQLEVNEANKPILDKYFQKLKELTTVYKEQSTQLDIDKINEKSINALIDNLQLRLVLLLQLKEQLQIIKTKQNDKNNI